MRMGAKFVAALLAATCLMVSRVAAQNFPTKQITIVVANTPGNPLDSTPRLIAPEMSKILGVPVIVENKPGAGQVLGYEHVLGQPADGYTILLAARETTAAMKLFTPDLRFDP